jgi:hypothetical protein
MANIIPHQPIIFDQEANCWLEDSGLKVLAEHGDITQFQMELEPCGSDVQLIQNGNFNGGSNWTTTSGAWTFTTFSANKAQGLSGQLFQSAPTTDGTLCRLTFDITAISGGELNVSFNGNTQYVSEVGSYEFWLESQSSSSVSFAASGAVSCVLENVQLITINTDFQVNILDENGSVVDTLETSDGYFDFSDGYFTCSIDWEALAIPNGCYTLQVVDPCPCSQRGIIALDMLSGVHNWSTSAEWTIGGGGADFSGSSTGVALLSNVVCSDVEYQVTYTVFGLTGTVSAQIGLGSVYGTSRTSDGTYTETITSNGTSFRMRGTPTGAASFTLKTVSIVAIDPIETIESNQVKVSEEFNCSTLALAMCNDSDAMGFGFANTGFRPLMRLPASLVRSSYPMERLAYDNSRGRKSPYYGRLRKARELGFDGLEFMHDFAALWLICDHFYIDDVEYFVEDDEYPSISWSEADDVGGVTLNVSEKVQLVENRRLSSASIGCEPNGSILLDNQEEPILDSQDERITTP